MMKQKSDTEMCVSAVSSECQVCLNGELLWYICKFAALQRYNCRTVF